MKASPACRVLCCALLLASAFAPPAAAQGRVSEVGASIRNLRADELTAAGVTQPGGALVQEIQQGSPAARAGLRRGDIIVEFDGERVRSAGQLTRLVRESVPERAVKVVVVREGARHELEITPEASQRLTFAVPPHFSFDLDPEALRELMPQGRAGTRLGVSLNPLTPQLAGYFGVEGGVLVAAVIPDSAAARAGIRAGDVIVEVNGTPVRSPADVVRVTRGLREESAVDVRLFRDRREMTLKVTFGSAAGPLPV